jgi:hypothetical protein
MFEALDRSELPMTVKMNSILSQELKNITLDENHFMLPVPDHNDPTGMNVTVYLFGTKEWVNIQISTRNKVNDVIKHLITITKCEIKDPLAYEIRLIDDDEDYYIPFYEISALERNDCVGEFKSLALVKNSGYQPPKPANIEDLHELRETKWKSGDLFTIYVKLPFLEATINMEMKTKKTTLGDLLKRINKKYEVDLRENLFCFKVHSNDAAEVSENSIESIVYNQNMLDNKLLLKNLPARELDLVSKVYGDSIVGNQEVSHEEIISCSMKITGLSPYSDSHRMTFIPMDTGLDRLDSDSPQRHRATERIETTRDVRDFLFNDLTAKKLQEFEVIKINSKGKRQK